MARIPFWKVALAAIALVAGTVGLAYAVDLPDQAADRATENATGTDDGDGPSPERRVGSRGQEPVNEDVQAVIDDRDEGGCEFGQAVAEAARGDHGQAAEAACGRGGDESGDGDDPKGSRATGEEHSADAGGAASDGPDDRGANSGRGNGDGPSDDGKEKGEDASEEGRDHAPADEDDDEEDDDEEDEEDLKDEEDEEDDEDE